MVEFYLSINPSRTPRSYARQSVGEAWNSLVHEDVARLAPRSGERSYDHASSILCRYLWPKNLRIVWDFAEKKWSLRGRKVVAEFARISVCFWDESVSAARRKSGDFRYTRASTILCLWPKGLRGAAKKQLALRHSSAKVSSCSFLNLKSLHYTTRTSRSGDVMGGIDPGRPRQRATTRPPCFSMYELSDRLATPKLAPAF